MGLEPRPAIENGHPIKKAHIKRAEGGGESRMTHHQNNKRMLRYHEPEMTILCLTAYFI